ncbi:MAG TPA: COG1361 S-layer family protein [Candidatus Nanoarchaeia archaeon]|nr:COG1361 S-layer family protein [Candidatus Nanoarchaeia archaeon]
MKKIILVVLIGMLIFGFAGMVDAGSSITFPGNKLKISLVSQLPDPVRPGEVFDLKIRAQSVSSASRQNYAIKGLKIEMIKEYPFSVIESESYARDLGTLLESEARDVTYRIRVAPDAPDGVNRLRFRYSSESEANLEGEGYLSINVRTIESTLAIASLKSSPEKIPAGAQAELILGIKNAAPSSMRDVAVKMDLSGTPFTPLETSSERRILQLSPGQEANVMFKVIADTNAESKPYRVPVVLTYLDDQNNKFSRNDSIGLLIYSAPELDYNIDESKVYKKGGTGEVIISVSNIGPSEVKFINLEMMKSDDYKIISTEKVYLGNLDPDDFQTASFKIHVEKSNPQLLFGVSYKDAYNKEFNEKVELGMKTYSGSQAADYGLEKPGFGVLQLIFLIIGIVFVYHVFKGLRHKMSIGNSLMHAGKRTVVHIARFVLWFRWRNLKILPGRLKKMLKEDGQVR